MLSEKRCKVTTFYNTDKTNERFFPKLYENVGLSLHFMPFSLCLYRFFELTLYSKSSEHDERQGILLF